MLTFIADVNDWRTDVMLLVTAEVRHPGVPA